MSDRETDQRPALAWKLLWLATDTYPQGKDLYDAVLLAEHTTVDQSLVRQLMRPELGPEADTFRAETVLSWAVDCLLGERVGKPTGSHVVESRRVTPGVPPAAPGSMGRQVTDVRRRAASALPERALRSSSG